LARAQKRSNNNNIHIDSARKAQRTDNNTSESGDVLDCTSTVRDVNCDVNAVEVNTSSDVNTDNVNCDDSSVQDNYSSNVSDTDITGNNKTFLMCQL